MFQSITLCSHFIDRVLGAKVSALGLELALLPVHLGRLAPVGLVRDGSAPFRGFFRVHSFLGLERLCVRLDGPSGLSERQCLFAEPLDRRRKVLRVGLPTVVPELAHFAILVSFSPSVDNTRKFSLLL